MKLERRQLHVLVASMAASLLVAACASPEEIRAADRRTCAGYGFADGTDAFANCMMTADQNRQRAEADRQRQWQAEEQQRRFLDEQRRQADQQHRSEMQRSTQEQSQRPVQTLSPSGQRCTTVTSASGNASESRTVCTGGM